MVDDSYIFPKLNPLPSVDNPRDSAENPLAGNRHKKKKGDKKEAPADESVPGQDEIPEEDRKPVGKVLDIKV